MGLVYCLWEWKFLCLRADCPHTLSVVTAAVAPFNIARIVAVVVRAVRITRIERTGPVEAERTSVVETRAVAVPRSGKEDRIVVSLALYYIAIYSCALIVCGPGPGAIAAEFVLLCLGRHSPAAAPVGCCSIIGGSKHLG